MLFFQGPLFRKRAPIKQLVRLHSGAAFVEYVILLGALSVILLPFVIDIGDNVENVVGEVSSQIENGGETGGPDGGGGPVSSTPISSTPIDPLDPAPPPVTGGGSGGIPVPPIDLTAPTLPVDFPEVGPGTVAPPAWCPPGRWVWDPTRGVYQVPGVALPRTSSFRVGNWHTKGVHPNGIDGTMDINPSYPGGYDWWGDYIGIRAYVWDAWMWTEYYPPGFLPYYDPGCPLRDASGVPEAPVWSVGTGNPSGAPGTNGYGVGEEGFLMGTPGVDALTATITHRGVNALASDDTLTTSSYSNDMIWIGGLGDDVITSRNGNDLFQYRAGDGSDTIREQGGTTFASIYDLFYAQNIAYNDVVFGVDNANPEDLRMTMPDGAVVVLENHHEVRPSGRVDFFQFGTTTLTWSQVRDRALEQMKATGLVIGSTDANTFTHRAGDPSYTIRSRGIDSFTRDNVLVFANANSDEVVFAQSGNSITITSSDGSVVTLLNQLTETVSNRMDRVEFADGVSYTGDAIRVRMLSETAMSGAVVGNSTNGVYFFRVGNGNVSLSDSGGTDMVVFDGIASNEVAFGCVGTTDVLRIQHLASGEYLDIANQFTSTASGHIESLVFTDRTYTRAQGIQRYLDDAMRGALGATVAYGNSLDSVYTTRAADPSTAINELSTGGTDTVVFEDVAYAAGTTVFGRSGNNLTITAGSKTITVVDQFGTDSGDWVESFQFSDGTSFNRIQSLREYNRAALAAGATAFGSAADDIYPFSVGTPSASVDEDAFGGNGNDQVLLTGYTISQAVFGRSGNNMTVTLPGSVVLTVVQQYSSTASDQVESFVFDDGTVTRASAIERVLGSNMAAGGTVQGTSGSDEFVYFASFPSVSVQENNTGGTDTLRFADLNLSDMTLVARTGTFTDASDSNLTFTTPDGDTVTLISYYSSTANRRIENIVFADGSTYTVDQMMDEVFARTMASGGLVYGTWRNDVFTVPSSGPDITIRELATGGSETVVFQDVSSSDVLVTALNTSGNLRNLSVRFPSGRVVTLQGVSTDPVNRPSELENFTFINGTLTSTQLFALQHAAAFASGGTAVGSFLTDTFTVPSSGPSATIFENGSSTGNDTVVFPIPSTSVALSRSGASLSLSFGLGGGRTILVTDIWESVAAAVRQIELFTFSDGVTWTREEVSQQYLNQALASSATTVFGTPFDDTYTYNRSFGNRSFDEANLGGNDTLFMNDVASTEVSWSRSGFGIVMSFGGGTVTILNQTRAGAFYHLDRVTFSNGVTVTRADMLVLAP